MAKRYLYHRAQDAADIVGDKLVPLNQLKAIDSEAYRRGAAKYDNRKPVMDLVIPKFDCLWNDVIFMSPVHPARIKQLYEEVVGPFRGVRYFKIDADLLVEPTLVWLWDTDSDERYRPESFVTFNPEEFDRYDIIPPETRAYYEDCVRKNFRPLIWYQVPHVLYHGSLNLSDLEIIAID